MICTGSHSNCSSLKYRLVAISGNRGKDSNFLGECFSALAPKYEFWKIWHDNIGIIDEYENNRYYIEEYYKQVLSKLDPNEVYRYLDGSILLCYEDSLQFCHRHVVAAWLELELNTLVPEVKILDNQLVFLERPTYIKEELIGVMGKNLTLKKI